MRVACEASALVADQTFKGKVDSSTIFSLNTEGRFDLWQLLDLICNLFE